MTPDEIKEAVKEAVKEATATHPCRFQIISDTDAIELQHGVKACSDLGEGNIARGVKIMQANHEWIYLARRKADKAFSVIFVILLTALVSGVVGALWLGVKSMIGGDE